MALKKERLQALLEAKDLERVKLVWTCPVHGRILPTEVGYLKQPTIKKLLYVRQFGLYLDVRESYSL